MINGGQGYLIKFSFMSDWRWVFNFDLKYEYVNFDYVDNLDETSRGEGGFGSTGT